jgi:hypothetical protein
METGPFASAGSSGRPILRRGGSGRPHRRATIARATGRIFTVLALSACALLAPQAARAGDHDDDGRADAFDNCPYAANPGQEDSGGLDGTGADGVGDACQCGDVTGDGRITLADGIAIRRSLLVPPTASLTQPELCDVGGSAGCSIADALAISRALLQPPTATIRPQCGPAVAQAVGHVRGIQGRVRARRLSGDVVLPGATVFVRDAGGVEQPLLVTTDPEGRYPSRNRPAGTYTVCARAFGFLESCHPASVVLGADPRDDVRDLVLDPVGGALHGRVLLADGSPCFANALGALPEIHATVSVVGGLPVTGGADGSYVLPGVAGPGALELDVTCAAETRRLRAVVDDGHLTGRTALDLTLLNRAPRIELLYAQDRSGKGLRRTAPGAGVRAVASVVDEDGDALAFSWRGNGAQTSFPSAPQVDWTLLPVNARNTLRLVVDDGRGGRSAGLLELVGGAPGVRFAGAVVDPAGAPIAGVDVTVGATTAVTDGDGAFALTVPEATRHLLRARKRGFGPFARAYFGGSPALRIALRPAERVDFDATPGVTARTQDGRVRVEIPRLGLVDANGVPASGPLSVELHAIDPVVDGAFGDGSVRTLAGGDATLEPQAGLAVEIFDAAGTVYDIAPGRTAKISFQAPVPPPGAPPPATLPLLRFDEAAGVWEERGTASLAGNRYDATVASFSAWTIGIYGPSRACLRLTVDSDTQERPFHLQIFDTKLVFGIRQPDDKILDETLSDPINLVNRLAANTWFALAVGPRDYPEKITNVQFVNSGPGVNPAEQPYPYTACVPVTLKGGIPVDHDWLDLLPYEDSAEDVRATEAWDYYDDIGATTFTPTFQAWKAFYGFTASDEAKEVAFVNKNELGIGRRGTCREVTPAGPLPSIACYVVKYGHVGSFDAALDDAIQDVDPGDTVAMVWGSPFAIETDPPSARIAKFYIFGPDGQLKSRTTFDSKGEVRYVPGSCHHCHGMAPMADDGRFVPFDVWSYGFAASGPWSRSGQQERFRALNALIAKTHTPGSPGQYLLDRIYPNGTLGTPGSEAVVEPAAPAWQALPGGYDAWTQVLKPSCMGCHMWWGAAGNVFRDPDSWIPWSMACGGWMPRAMAPALRLFRTSDPFLPNLVMDAKGYPRCGQSARPSVTITAPPDGSSSPYASFTGITLEATASDPEDGSACCTIEWSVDGWGVLGYGSPLHTTFPFVGTRIVRATAYDSDGQPSVPSDAITIDFVNDPPQPEILAPANGATLTPGLPYGFSGTTFDGNEDYFTIACGSLTWRTTVTADGTRTGCNPIWSFATPGVRIVTLEATDTLGDIGTDQILVNVASPPPGGPPAVAILTPGHGQSFDRTAPIDTSGAAVDTDRVQQSITYRWAVQIGNAPEITIGTAQSFPWLPSDQVPFHCGGQSVKLRLYATDPDGTAMAEITLWLADPPC